MSTLKIVRGEVEAEIVAQYLSEFLADGWKLKKSDEELAIEAAEKAEKDLAETQAKLDAEAKLDEESKKKAEDEAEKAKASQKHK